MKYGITSNLTADFTVNPDFSQIESDQPADRGQPAFSDLLQRAAAVLPGGVGDLQHPGAGHVSCTRAPSWTPTTGAKLTGQVETSAVGVVAANDRAPGRLDDTIARGVRADRRTLHQPAPVRPIDGVECRRDLHGPRVPGLPQPAGRPGQQLPPQPHACVGLPGVPVRSPGSEQNDRLVMYTPRA